MLFSSRKEKIHIGRFVPLIILLAFLVFFWIFSSSLSSDNDARNKELLERALSRSITQCYALEGTYPPNLKYLTDHYGLHYDSDNYYIDYQYIGSNLRPDVTIIERH